MSCLVVSIHRKDENINTIITKIGESLNITIKNKNPILNIRCSTLCSVGAVDNRYEVFEASDGVFMLYDGELFNVIKEDGV